MTGREEGRPMKGKALSSRGRARGDSGMTGEGVGGSSELRTGCNQVCEGRGGEWGGHG